MINAAIAYLIRDSEVVKLPSMQQRFLRATLITVYKLLHGYLKLSAVKFFEVPAAGSTRRYNFKIRQLRIHRARRKVAFVERSAGPWNRLPPHIAKAPIVFSFKDCSDTN